MVGRAGASYFYFVKACEAKAVSVGLTGGSPNLLYINGQTHSKIENANLVDELEAQIRSQLKSV